MVKISFILPNYQGKKIFAECMRGLLKQKFTDYEIVFVDDGSSDGSYEHAVKLFGKQKKVVLVQKKKNTGFVGACNTALKHCKGKYIIIGNNDCYYPPNWFGEMYKTVKGRKKVMGGSTVIHGKNTDQFKQWKKGYCPVANMLGFGGGWRKLAPVEKKNRLFESHNAGAVIIPRSAVPTYIYERDYFAYSEDVELSWRLRLQGYHVVANYDARIETDGSYTRKIDRRFNKRALYYGTRNRIVNFIIFYELPNLLKLSLPIATMQALLFIVGPRAMHLRLKAYWWIISNWGEVMRRRKKIQKSRVIDDVEIMRLLSYKTGFAPMFDNKILKGLAHVGDFLLRTYCIILGVPAFDIRDSDAVPAIDPKLVTRRKV